MIERIDESLCTGCGTCINSCPMDVIRMDEDNGRAFIAYQEDCSLCAVCEVDCPVGAIYVNPEKHMPMPTCWGM